jgi:hypothetical protein
MEIKLPEYISISEYKQIVSQEHLSDLDKIITQLSILSGISLDTIRGWQGNDLSKVIDQMTELINSTKPEFYPLIEFEGKTYGFSALSKMTLGEFVDLENLLKSPNENLSQIMALLYRETTENKFDTFKWKLKSRVKLAIGKTENLFKYYKIKPYNSDERELNADTFDKFPVQYILGALFFFMLIKTEHSKDILLSLAQGMKKMEIMEMMEEGTANLMLSIGDGLAQFMVYPKPVSFQLQETKPSQI